MGHALVPALTDMGLDVVALDLRELPPSTASLCAELVLGSLLDRAVLADLFERRHPEIVFHLAAVLSSKGEQSPELAHQVNVEGTIGLMGLAMEEARRAGRPVRFLFPSSIAIYGLPDRRAKEAAGAVREEEWNLPTGMYGCNKLYGELLGAYWTRRAARDGVAGLDFRSLRFPGLISADTLPIGGTTDYAPEMIHAAAQGKPYACFVEPETRLPFMTMPDAVESFLRLAQASAEALGTRVYNIGAFSPSAAELREAVLEHFPAADISFDPQPGRQAIVDTWPASVDDGGARRDWGHSPRHGLREAIGEYLVPKLRRLYPARANP
jgi:nucleoside-diphosphate-sugar epimerase